MRPTTLLISAAFALAMTVSNITIPVSSAEAAGSGCLPGILKQRLAQIRRQFGPVKVISTFRRGARIRGSGRRSHHASCRAVDFKAPPGKHSQVVAWLKRVHSGGVGTYSCGMHHIHIDNGAKVRYHHCVTASGTPRRSGKRRRTARASKIRPSSRRATRSAQSRTTSKRIASSRRTTTRKLPVRTQRQTPQTKLAAKTKRSFTALGHFNRNKADGG